MKHVSASHHQSIPALLSFQSGQLLLLFVSLACCGSIVGLSRLLPHLATHTFHTPQQSTVLYFVVIFGGSKACLNLLSAHWASSISRQYLLQLGWFLSFQSPFFITIADSWNQCLAATLFLGASQGILTSICVIMIMDRVSPHHRGIANGILECIIYVCLACWTFIAALIEERAGYRPWICIVSMIITMIGFTISLFITDTTALVKQESDRQEERELSTLGSTNGHDNTTTEPAVLTSSASLSLSMTISHCLSRPHLLALLLSGFSNNVKDGIAWGCFPAFYAKEHLSLPSISYLLFAYPFVWGVGQLFAGEASDRYGRKRMIVSGLMIQAIALGIMGITAAINHTTTASSLSSPISPTLALSSSSSSYLVYLLSSILLGLGTALCYPVLQASLSDAVRPQYRASSLGVYRLCRDAGYVFGGVVSGYVADRFDLNSVIECLSLLLLCSAIYAHVRLVTDTRSLVPV